MSAPALERIETAKPSALLAGLPVTVDRDYSSHPYAIKFDETYPTELRNRVRRVGSAACVYAAVDVFRAVVRVCAGIQRPAGPSRSSRLQQFSTLPPGKFNVLADVPLLQPFPRRMRADARSERYSY